LFRLVCGKFPFCDPDRDSLDTLKKNVSSSLLDFPPEISSELRDLLSGMLSRTEDDRFGWTQILEHPWLKK